MSLGPVFEAITTALTAATGQPWSLDADVLHGPDDAALWLGVSGSRLEISGQCGEARNLLRQGEGPFVVTVALDREPAAIAGEITRRLLPRYLPALAAARLRLAEVEQNTRQAEATLDELLELAGGGRRTSSPKEIEGFTQLDTVYRIRLFPARRQPSGELGAMATSIELRMLDIDTARDLLRLLRGRANRHEATS